MDTLWKRASADWLFEAKWGTMTHFLADAASNRDAVTLGIDDWNRRVESVDVDRLAEQIAGTGSRYHIFTVGQNSGFYCAPNGTYDGLVGTPSRLSKRDLVADLAAALGRRGVRTIAYVPSHAPALHRQAVEAIGFTPRWDMSNTGIRPGTYLASPDADDRLTIALRNWEAILTEWSQRWGKKVSGWWIDGCYNDAKLYRHPDPPNFQSLAEAMKSGNPDALVAFNHGVRMPVVCTSPYDDYTAGEVNDFWIGHRGNAPQRFLDGAQLHILTFLGAYWGQGPVRVNADLAAGYTAHINAAGGAVTWDIPISPAGSIPEEFERALCSITERLRMGYQSA